MLCSWELPIDYSKFSFSSQWYSDKDIYGDRRNLDVIIEPRSEVLYSLRTSVHKLLTLPPNITLIN